MLTFDIKRSSFLSVPWNVLANDSFTEDGSSEDVPDGSVWRLPHLLQLELGHSSLVRRDGGALDADVVLQDGVRAVNSNLNNI